MLVVGVGEEEGWIEYRARGLGRVVEERMDVD